MDFEPGISRSKLRRNKSVEKRIIDSDLQNKSYNKREVLTSSIYGIRLMLAKLEL